MRRTILLHSLGMNRKWMKRLDTTTASSTCGIKHVQYLLSDFIPTSWRTPDSLTRHREGNVRVQTGEVNLHNHLTLTNKCIFLLRASENRCVLGEQGFQRASEQALPTGNQ